MRRLDSYIFAQILGPFGFFSVVFVGVIWLTQSLRVIDTVVNNGQSAWVFLEFTGLLFPLVLGIVLPIALFAAVLYAINRLFTDSEIVVMQASGLSSTALLRAVTVFATLVMIGSYFITLYLMPTAQREMRDRISEIRGDIAAAFVREGEFLTPVRDVTFYLRATGESGEMFGVFLQDERDPNQIVTYTSERALLIRDDDGTRLLMFNGVAQSTESLTDTNLSILRFEQFAYDLTQFAQDNSGRIRKPSEMYLPELLAMTEDRAQPRQLGDFIAEAHEALTSPLYTLALPLLAVAFVIAGGYRRQGFAGRILVAVGVAVSLRILGLAAKSAVTNAEGLWPLMYAPPILGIVLAVWLLSGRGFSLFRMARAG